MHARAIGERIGGGARRRGALAFGWALSALACAAAPAQVPLEDFPAAGTLSQPPWSISPAESSGLVTFGAETDPEGQDGILRLGPGGPTVSITRAVSAAEAALWGPGGPSVAFADFYIRPAVDASAQPATSVDFDGAKLGFAPDPAQGFGRLHIHDGEAGSTAPIDLAFGLGGDGAASGWLRITVRRDYAHSPDEFDVWVDGALHAARVPVDVDALELAAPTSLTLDGDALAPVRLDRLQIVAANPLFADADSDGMPDAFESARGLDPGGDDREADSDGDGAPNIEEYVSGAAPDDPDDAPRQVAGPFFVYVDGASGHEAFNGLASHPCALGGPKPTLHEGISVWAASDPDDPAAGVIVRAVAAPYVEGSIRPGAGALSLRPLGNVILRPPTDP